MHALGTPVSWRPRLRRPTAPLPCSKTGPKTADNAYGYGALIEYQL